MPYVHVALVAGRSVNEKRSLISGLTDTTLRLLEVSPIDVHVYLWELDATNIGIAGEEPSAAALNDITVFLRDGRHIDVKAAYANALAETVCERLLVDKKDVHVVLAEVPPGNIAEGGVPLGPPAQPRWFVASRPVAST
jgi:4-oxalocrotonate tautomerase family enzyme